MQQSSNFQSNYQAVECGEILNFQKKYSSFMLSMTKWKEIAPDYHQFFH